MPPTAGEIDNQRSTSEGAAKESNSCAGSSPAALPNTAVGAVTIPTDAGNVDAGP